MAVLGKIRQRSVFLILIIGMALFAFVISGVFDTSGNAGPSDPIGTVNGEDIEVDSFRFKVEQLQRSYNTTLLQAVNDVWNETVTNLLFDQEFNELGIDAGKEQIEQFISSNPNIVNNPEFQNETGFFDFGIFADYIARLKVENPSAYLSWQAQEQGIVNRAKQNIYYNLIKSGSKLTQEEAKSDYHMENDNLNLKFVRIPYDFIPDSLVSVSDSEIEKYIREHKEKYQQEATRNIQYVYFDEKATVEDERIIEEELKKILDRQISYNEVSKLTDTIEGLKTTKNVTDFIDQYSEVPFDSTYVPKGQLANEYANVLFDLNEGEAFGPYKDGKTLKISRMMGRKNNSSIRASHILVGYAGAFRAASDIIRTKEEARAKANSLLRRVRRNRDDFETIARENSDDPSKTLGGDLGFFQEREMAAPFFEFCNRSRINTIGLVETEFGFHIIKVTDKKDLVLIASVVKSIIPSDNTSNEIFRKATQYEMDVMADSNSFVSIAETSEYEVRPVQSIVAMEENLPGLGRQRAVVNWVYSDDVKVGDIKRFNLNQGGYAVVQLTGTQKEGLAFNDDRVRLEVTAILKNQKKATQIQEKYGNVSTLEALTEMNPSFIVENASAINQRNAILVGAGSEPYVVGTAFAMNEGDVSNFIPGEKAVYKIEVLTKNTAIDLNSYDGYAAAVTNQRFNNTTLPKAIIEALKSAADIEDNRILYY